MIVYTVQRRRKLMMLLVECSMLRCTVIYKVRQLRFNRGIMSDLFAYVSLGNSYQKAQWLHGIRRYPVRYEMRDA